MPGCRRRWLSELSLLCQRLLQPQPPTVSRSRQVLRGHPHQPIADSKPITSSVAPVLTTGCCCCCCCYCKKITSGKDDPRRRPGGNASDAVGPSARYHAAAVCRWYRRRKNRSFNVHRLRGWVTNGRRISHLLQEGVTEYTPPSDLLCQGTDMNCSHQLLVSLTSNWRSVSAACDDQAPCSTIVAVIVANTVYSQL